LHHLEAVRLQVGEQEKQPSFRCRQGAGLIDGKLAGGSGCPIEAPHGYMCVKRRLKGRDQLLKLVEGQAGHIQELRGAILHVGALEMRHGRCLLSWEAQYIINRDNLR
jgi:hypothetical protein